MIEVTEVVVHKADEPDVVTHLFDAHPLAGEDLTEVHLASVEADAATVRHGRRLVVERIVQVAQAAISTSASSRPVIVSTASR